MPQLLNEHGKNEAFKNAAHLCAAIYNLSLELGYASPYKVEDQKRKIAKTIAEIFENSENQKALDEKIKKYEKLKMECLRQHDYIVSSISNPFGSLEFSPAWGLRYAIYCTSRPQIVESDKNRVGNLYLPISLQLAADLLESYEAIASKVLRKCFSLSEGYIKAHWENGVPIDKAQYIILPAKFYV